MARRDLEIAVDWAAAEGWNPGLHDADCFYAADPEGFLMGWLDDAPIAAISVVKYGASFGFLGFYIVKPEFRGRGYGWRLWQAGLTTLAGRTVGLDGVVEQQPNYLKSGFQFAHRNIRYEGWGHGGSESVAAAIVPLSTLPLAAVMDYDRPFFPDTRTAFLRAWLAQPGCTRLGSVERHMLRGYGMLRPCRRGYKMGPLFADTSEIAEALFLALRAQVPPQQPFYLDVPEVNGAAVAIAQKHALVRQFETARMYRPEVLHLPIDRIFGITTFELG